MLFSVFGVAVSGVSVRWCSGGVALWLYGGVAGAGVLVSPAPCACSEPPPHFKDTLKIRYVQHKYFGQPIYFNFATYHACQINMF